MLINTGNSKCEAQLQPTRAGIEVEGGGCELHQISESTESLVRAEAAERCRYSAEAELRASKGSSSLRAAAKRWGWNAE